MDPYELTSSLLFSTTILKVESPMDVWFDNSTKFLEETEICANLREDFSTFHFGTYFDWSLPNRCDATIN